MSGNDLQAFVDKWTASGASESSNSQYFLLELCDVLGVPRPDGAKGDAGADDYVFEKDAPVIHEGGATSVKKIDLYRAGHFILEAKQGSEKGSKKLGTAKRNTPGWNQAMNDAYGQALGYARSFDEPVPFVVVCDIGYCFELYSDFGADYQYRSFPNAQQKRVYLKDLPKNPLLVERLQKVFTAPHALDPAKNAAKVTREVAGHLAELAKRLEKAGHNQVSVAQFLMRCLFTMFAEDVGLLPDNLFTNYLRDFWVKSPASFPGGIQSLWQAMNTGGHLPTAKVLRFNGGLFSACEALPLDEGDIKLLQSAAECDWSDVEPAIFGTLLERALDANERHRLGAHYTPRAYVERLVRPTIEEPLREEWDQIRIEVRGLVTAAENANTQKARTTNLNKAEKILKAFHNRLLALRILDPACGTGNFLYVAMDTLKRLESEVLAELAAIQGGDQDLLHFEGARISPEQFLGIEIKPWAKEIAELVLWIGYLQWHFKQYGKTVQVPEPVLRDYKNIECRDAVLAYDKEEIVVDAMGKPVTRWDGVTMKVHPVTGKEVPDESAAALLYEYTNPRQAEWPKADFVVGNPPFVGNKMMRQSLGDGYSDALRGAYPDVPETADLVMFWWHKASEMLGAGGIQQYGLISTNSITQSQQRQIVSRAFERFPEIRFVFAIPDHPWVEAESGAAVRIAMSVVGRGRNVGILGEVESELSTDADHRDVNLNFRRGNIQADFRIGAAVSSCMKLQSNQGLSFMGVTLVGKGFRLDRGELKELQVDPERLPSVVKPYRSGKELTQKAVERWIIDFYGVSIDDAREHFPGLVQRLVDTVLPLRRENKRESYRKAWHIFGEPRGRMRNALLSLPRFIATLETSKHRVFQFLPGQTLPDHSLYAIASPSALVHGVLSSRAHVVFAIAAGSRLGIGNDARWRNAACFDPFPMPNAEGETAKKIENLAERLDAHRKNQQARHSDLTITGMYNVLERLCAEEPLSAKEKKIHEQGLVSILKQLHDDLDAAVFDAYGWPHDLTDEQILERLVALNYERAEEEKRGTIRWLRPEFQNPEGPAAQQGLQGLDEINDNDGSPMATAVASAVSPWPKKLSEQISAIRDLVTPGVEWSAQAAANTFKAANLDQVQEIMESLAALGMLIELERANERVWTAPKVQG